MNNAPCYRQWAAHLRDMADSVYQGELREILLGAVRDYDHSAEDIEAKAIETRHPERMLQHRR